MKSTHMLKVYRGGHAVYYGALCPKRGSLLSSGADVLNLSLDLNLISHEQAHRLWSHLWRRAPDESAVVAFMHDLEALLSAYAAPGYEFQPWFTKAGTFWGWFPRVG